ncbi:uncharacterized protein ACLA_096830 [Aspergillus clavatus NRRL 1]|uniref:Uncharacterized protein n=1 Tax=Aspergillus clavatus (strain ATCC 1007 / CBS 513.65 / DSM 816 / NCTC 3887 / NRRL 1 / QM 1276 / 107) TaxID=344612 RepID=A1CMG2_ASPCL|nr:uncharacterized protein ACLA_096830 [Aspergillus clavatus NRRL 1]EAW08749.1 conserved hypothetical protein [Aspergillus clavatus NRRL 1]
MLALTPIRVRGRRKNPPAKKVTHGHGPRAVPSGRKGGRPLMTRHARLHSSQSRSISRARLWVARARKPRKRLSRLEALPVELIEKIFLYSLNVNLPRSSLALAAAMSSERIYRVLILLAFWNDSASEAVEAPGSAIARILRPLDSYAPVQDGERDGFQASILRCRWCTIPRLLSHIPDMMNLTIQRHWVNVGITMTGDQHTTLNRFLTREEDTCTYEGTDADSKHYTLSITPFVSIAIACHETDEQQTHRILNIRQFPEKLLRGSDEGFTEEHTLSLEILRLACGFNRSDHLETDIAIPRDSLQDGIHLALVENNLLALTALLKIDEYVFRSAAAVTGSQPYTLPAEHFRTAVRVARHDPALFQQLLRASAESVPADDPEITEWAMHLGDAFGHWLLDLMLRLPQQIETAHANPAEGALFYLGRANGHIEMARRYLRDVLGVEELGSWMESTPVDLSSLWMVRNGEG